MRRRRRVPVTLLALFMIAGALLAWQIVIRGIGGTLWESAPELVLAVRGDDARSLIQLAEKQLSTRQTPGDSDPRAEARELQNLGERALQAEPLNVAAIRTLALAAERARNEAHALELMTIAGRRSLRDTTTTAWLLHKSLERQDFAEALRRAEALWRTRVKLRPDADVADRREVREQLLPTLAAIASHPEGSQAMIDRLATNPPWRASFLAELPKHVPDAGTLLPIYRSLKDSAFPPTATELRPLLDKLIGQDLIELSYYVWLEFLPAERLAEVGHLYNGSFEHEPTNLPFDWVITLTSGADIGIVPRSDLPGKHGLLIEFAHRRVPFQNVRQMVMLTPGHYTMTGSYRTIDLDNQRGMVWRIYCSGREKSPIAESERVSGTSSTWKEFSFSFEVPAAGCRAQWLRLELAARIAAETQVSGAIWYDDLKIGRPDHPDTD